MALAVLATILWLILNHWYSIRAGWDIEFFAFEKIRGAEGEPVLSTPLRWTAVIFPVLGLIYAAGWVILARMREVRKPARIAIILAGLAPGLVNVSLFPVGALDIFRYMVALKQYLYYGENPYILGFAQHEGDSFTQHGFLLTLPNAKGPAWLLLSAIPAEIGGFADPIRMLIALKLYNLALLGLTAWLIGKFFADPALRWLAIYAFWANPLVLLEGVGVVHNDVMIALFTVGALLALKRGSWLALPLLTLSVLVKYFTLQLGPLFLLVMIARKWRAKTIAWSIAASLLVAAACILPFWSDGEMVTGIDKVGDAYNRSNHVSIISLVRQYRIQDLDRDAARKLPLEQPIFAGILAVLALPFYWRARKGKHVERVALDVTLLFLMLLTLLYPWYLIPIVALLAMRRGPLDIAYLFVATTLGMYYPAYVWATYGSGLDRLHKHLYLSMFVLLPILAYFIARAIWWWLNSRSTRGRTSTQSA